MMHPARLSAGLEIGKYRGLNTVSHCRFGCRLSGQSDPVPDQHFSVAVLCNVASANPGALSRRIATSILGSYFAAATTRTRCCRRSRATSSWRKWTGLYVEPGEGDRVMRVRLRDGELQSGLDADGLALGWSNRRSPFSLHQGAATELVSRPAKMAPLIY